MKVFKMILKIIGLVVLFTFILAAIPLLINGDDLSGIISLLIGVIPSFFIIRSFSHSTSKKVPRPDKKKKETKYCPVCGKKMTWMNTPMFSSELKSGGKPCVLCLAKINKNNRNFMLHLNEYSIEDIKKILSDPPEKQMIPTANQDTTLIEHTISRTYTEPKVIEKEKSRSTINIDSMQIAGRTKQLLETLEIMETSPNPDTIVGRAKFFIEALNDLDQLKESKNYLTAIQQGIDEYKIAYYDKIIPQHHLIILLNPNETFPLFKKYYERCLIAGCLRFFSRQEEHMQQLKQQKAIDNRIKKSEEMLNYVYGEMQLAGLKDSDDILINELNKMKRKWSKDNLLQ